MDVDTPSGTNSGAGKKRFEVKKVRPAGALLQLAPEGGGGRGKPAGGERGGGEGDFPFPSQSRTPGSAPARRERRGGACGESWRASGPMAEAGRRTWSGG